jgi:hypothetical protein
MPILSQDIQRVYGMADKITFGNFTIEITRTSEEVTYKFAGDVDENFRHKDVPRIKATVIHFELSAVTNFNSCGIREWVYLVRDLGEMGQKIYFHNCSVPVIDQINMVPDSLGKGHIVSFYAPYFCQQHGEVNKLIVVDKHMKDLQAKRAPEMTCDQCSKVLDFDALEESYFLFFSTKSIPKAS